MAFKDWHAWQRTLLFAGAGLAVLYIAYAAFVSVSNGTEVHARILAGQDGQGMYYKCDMAQSTPGICTDGRQTTLTVHKRDKVTFTVVSEQGAGRTHDFRLEGASYFLWPSGIEMEIEDGEQTGSFVAWSTGEYRIICELAGHEEAGMWATLKVVD